MNLVLFQPAYPHGKRAWYLPGGLMNLGSRLIEAGVGISFFDLNFFDLGSLEVTTALKSAERIGFSVIGPPYIPVVVRNISTLRVLGFTQPVLVGGQGIAQVRPEDFSRWFKDLGEVIQVCGDRDMLAPLGLTSVTSAFATSMVPMLRRLSETHRRLYFGGELGLFVSQGCKYNCDFCAAPKAQTEQYRTLETLADEADFLCKEYARLGIPIVRVYLSNLDAFQNPGQLVQALRVLSECASWHGISIHIRCLATTECTVVACEADPALPRRLYEHGLRVVGFGVDGADPETWARENKKHNDPKEIEDSRKYMQRAGIQVETLMIIGFKKDPWKSTWHSFLFSLRAVAKGTVLRPYLGKYVPGGRWPLPKGKVPKPGRTVVTEEEVQVFLNDATLLTHLDYAGIASPQTHPDWRERWRSNLLYLTLIGLLIPFGKCCTYPLFPVPRKGLGKWFFKTINRLMPFDK